MNPSSVSWHFSTRQALGKDNAISVNKHLRLLQIELVNRYIPFELVPSLFLIVDIIATVDTLQDGRRKLNGELCCATRLIQCSTPDYEEEDL